MNKHDWKTTPLNPNDFYQLGMFFKNFFTGPETYGSQGLFTWKLQKNSVGEGLVNAIKDGDTIASTASFTPKSIFIHGEREVCAEIGDTYTQTAYQRKGMFQILINKTRIDANGRGISFIYGLPNDQSLPGYCKHADFMVIPGSLVRRLVLPLKIDRLLAKKRIPQWLAKILSAFYESFFSLKYFSDLQKNGGELAKSLPGDWDEFWEKQRAKNDFIVDRSASQLNWRFFQNPNNYDFSIYRGSGLFGYVVSRQAFREGQIRLIIADYLFSEEGLAFLSGAFRHEISKAIRQGAEAVECWVVGDTPYYRELLKLGFKDRGEVKIICHKTDRTQTWQQTNKWHFTISDSDNI